MARTRENLPLELSGSSRVSAVSDGISGSDSRKRRFLRIVLEIPYYFNRIDLKVYVDDVIHQIVTNKKIDENILLDYAIATAACKASLKANTFLTTLDMENLINDLFKCEDPYTCPHGRPTMVKYSKYELERFFKRA